MSMKTERGRSFKVVARRRRTAARPDPPAGFATGPARSERRGLGRSRPRRKGLRRHPAARTGPVAPPAGRGRKRDRSDWATAA